MESKLSSSKRILFCGLGTRTDILNASLLYYISKYDQVQQGGTASNNCLLSLCRPICIDQIEYEEKFAPCGAVISASKLGDLDPHLAAKMTEKIIFFSRQNQEGKFDENALKESIATAISHFRITDIVTVEAGGTTMVLDTDDLKRDSMSLHRTDCVNTSLLSAIMSTAASANVNLYHAVIAPVWLDSRRFKRNIEQIDHHDGYFGRVNLKTGQQEGFKLGNMFQFTPGCLDYYLELAESMLALHNDGSENENKIYSSTCNAFYHALKGHHGPKKFQRSATDGHLGITVDEECSWLYFFDPRVVEKLRSSHTALRRTL